MKNEKELIDRELETDIQSENLREQKFDRELIECLTFLGLAVIIAVVGVRSIIWAIEFVLNRMG